MNSIRVTSQIKAFASTHRQALIVFVFVVIGVITILATKAAVLNSIIEPEDGSKTGNVQPVYDATASGGQAIRFKAAATSGTQCGKVVQNYSYDVPFGNAIWNQPICNVARHSQSDNFADRWWNWSYLNDGSPQYDIYNGKISVNPGFPKTPTLQDPTGLGTLYTTEVYYASDDAVDRLVTSILYQSNLDGEGYNSNPILPSPGKLSNHPDTKMPWNNNWKAAGGNDANVIVIDDRPGKEGTIYSVWGLNKGNCPYDVLFPNRVCAYRISIGRGFDGNVIDYRTHSGYTKDRGVGINPFATLTMADEVAAGEIRHALGVALPNNMFGPDCSPSQLHEPVNWNVVGRQCGTAVAPASKFEWVGVNELTIPEWAPLYTREKTIPEGMRFALDISYQDIEDWIDSRSDFTNNPRRAETARIFARALKDYGMMVVDSNSSRTGVQMEGGVNPVSAAKWRDLALGPEYSNNLLDGLITRDRVYVVDTPVNTCRDGSKSKFYCEWSDTSYQ